MGAIHMTFVLEPLLLAAGASAASASTAATAISAIGTVAGAFGAYSQGVGQQNIANYNAAIDRNNAYSATATADQEAGRLYDINRRKIGAARAQQGASGADMNIGSPVDVAADLAGQAALDEEIARWRGKVQSTGYMNSAAGMQYQGEQAYRAGIGRAGGMLLTGFGRLGGAAGGGSGASTSTGVDGWKL
jgi:hypothetical protein